MCYYIDMETETAQEVIVRVECIGTFPMKEGNFNSIGWMAAGLHRRVALTKNVTYPPKKFLRSQEEEIQLIFEGPENMVDEFVEGLQYAYGDKFDLKKTIIS